MESNKEAGNELSAAVQSELAEAIKNMGVGTPEEEAKRIIDFLWSHGTLVTKWDLFEKLEAQNEELRNLHKQIEQVNREHIDQLTQMVGLLKQENDLLRGGQGDPPALSILPG